MSINYLDTVTMYYSCCSDIRNLFMTHWIWDNNNKDIKYYNYYFNIETKRRVKFEGNRCS